MHNIHISVDSSLCCVNSIIICHDSRVLIQCHITNLWKRLILDILLWVMSLIVVYYNFNKTLISPGIYKRRQLCAKSVITNGLKCLIQSSLLPNKQSQKPYGVFISDKRLSYSSQLDELCLVIWYIFSINVDWFMVHDFYYHGLNMKYLSFVCHLSHLQII